MVVLYDPRSVVLAQRAKAAGVAANALRIVYEAKRAGLEVSLAFGLVEHESEFRNIFGCDQGGLFCHQPVTETKVRALLDHTAHGGISNGVGLTQLTYPPFIARADHMAGGAAVVRNQLRVGFTDLAALVKAYGTRGGLAAYNAGSPHSKQGLAYAARVMALRDHWHHVLVPQAH